MKRLGIYYATACYRDEAGRYYTSPGLGRYLQQMNRLYPFEVVLAAPTTTQPLPHLKSPLPGERVVVYELPYFESFLQAVRVRAGLCRKLRRFLHEHHVDVMWLRYPAAYATELWLECRRRRIPCFYEAVGDPVVQFELANRYPFPVQWLAKAVARWHEREMKAIARTTPIVAVAQSLANKLGADRTYWLPASTVIQEEMYYREDTCLSKPYRVLYVGGLLPYKSLDTLISAIALVQRRGYEVHLSIVGDGTERQSLQSLAAEVLLPNTYQFHGYCSDPRRLDQFYRESDLFAMSSVTEGFPRVILEAMARGLPVVATDIVGIPDLVRHGETGLLVPPRNPRALADAIIRVVEDGNLRRRLIAGGYEIARQHTAEAFLRKVVDFIREQVGVDLLEQEAAV